MPSSNGRLVEPEPQVASALQPCLVLRPVPDPVPCPEALGAVRVWSDGHEWASGLVEADHHLSGRAASSHLDAPTPLQALTCPKGPVMVRPRAIRTGPL